MLRLACHLLLSLALVFQGMAVACATGGNGNKHVLGSASALTHGAQPCCNHCSASKAAQGKSDGRAAGDCMHSCNMPAHFADFVLVVTPPLAPDALLAAPASSLLERAQVPPTPPPIA